ncbi:unnamed protein product [Closterium sp. NIES-64]|nr:unnamed protein product [Closterium sp. NIES-64]
MIPPFYTSLPLGHKSSISLPLLPPLSPLNHHWQAASLVAVGDVAALKDPHLQAPDDLVLCMARLALTCTAMPTASRPGMSRVLAELLLLKEEFYGEDEDRMAARIDHEIESSEQVDFSLELADIEGIQHGGPHYLARLGICRVLVVHSNGLNEVPPNGSVSPPPMGQSVRPIGPADILEMTQDSVRPFPVDPCK